MQSSDFRISNDAFTDRTASPVDDMVRDAIGRAAQKSRSANDRTVDAIGMLVRRVELSDDRHQKELVGIANECSSSLKSLRAVLNVLSHKLTSLESDMDNKRLFPIQEAYRALELKVEQIAAQRPEDTEPSELLPLLAKLDQNVIEIGLRLAEAQSARPDNTDQVVGLSGRLEQVTETLEKQTAELRAVQIQSGQSGEITIASEVGAALEGNKRAIDGLDERVALMADMLANGLSATQTRQVEDVLSVLSETGFAPGAFTRQTDLIETMDRRVQEVGQKIDEDLLALGVGVGTLEKGLGALEQGLGQKLDTALEAIQSKRQDVDLLPEINDKLIKLNGAFEALGANPFSSPDAVLNGDAAGSLRRDLGDLRVVQEAGDRRTLEALERLQKTLDVIGHKLDSQREGAAHATSEASAQTMHSAARAAASRALDEVGRDTIDQSRAKLIEPGMGRPALAQALAQAALTAEPASVAIPAENKAAEPVLRPAENEASEAAATNRTEEVSIREDLVSTARRSMQAKSGSALKAGKTRSFPAKPVALGVATLGLAVGGYYFVQQNLRIAPAPVAPAPAAVSPTTTQSIAPGTSSGQLFAKPSGDMRSSVQDGAKVIRVPANLAEVPTDMRGRFDAGNVEMVFEVGTRYLDGIGVTRDSAIAAKWLKQAAEQGSAKAAYRLGSGYEKGLFGERDLEQAKLWYNLAGTNGNVTAMHNLAVLLGGGEQGDFVQASSWFKKAAEHGLRDSQYNLGVLSARGLGGPVDLRAAYVWFSLAAASGDTSAATRRDEVARRLDPATLQSARADLQAFQPKAPSAAANELGKTAG